MQKHTILFLDASSSGDGQVALAREAHAIQEELMERAGFRDCFQFETRWAVEPLDLLRELVKLKPVVVHFSGHGDGRGGVRFRGSDGTPQLVAPEALSRTFEAAGSSVKLVIFSACYSQAQAKALLEHVDCVIGMSGSIHGDASRAFAIGFYGGLGQREDVASAYAQGCAAVSLEGLSDGAAFRLEVRAGVDAGRLVLIADPTAPPHRSPRVPDRHDIFVGREAELVRIGAVFDASTHHTVIVAVQGMAGVGKTYLAQELYARHAGRFGSYQHLVLDPEHPATVEASMAVLGKQAGIDLPQFDASAVAQALRAQQALVHIDNVDSVETAELVAALVLSLDGVATLVTGRYTELGTAAGAGWTRIELAPLETAAALELLRAELEGAGTSVTEAALRELVRQLAGLPLALHLAAGYLRRGMTVERFLARLRDKGLALGPRDPADHVLRDRARGVLSTSFAISRELMLAQAGAEAKAWETALTGIGWAPRAGFGRSLGAAITGLGMASGAFDDFIDASVSMSLVRRLRPEERSSEGWAVNSLLGEFLRGETDRMGIDNRIGLWIVRRTASPASEQGTRWAELSAEAVSIGEWLAVATDDIARKVVTAAWKFAVSRGPISPWLAAAKRVRQGTDRRLLWALCQLALNAGEQETVLAAAAEMARLAAAAGDDRDRALALGKVSDVHYARNEFDEVLRIRREEMLPVYERIGDDRERARTLEEIAGVLVKRGEVDEALRSLREEVLPVYERLGDESARAGTLGRLAEVLVTRGDLDEALRIQREEVLPVIERLGEERARAATLGRLAQVLRARGEVDEALRILRGEVLPIYQAMDDARGRSRTLVTIASLWADRGALEEALRVLREEALPVVDRSGDPAGRAAVLGEIAGVLAARGELDEALRIRRDEILPIYQRLGDMQARARTLVAIADAEATRGEHDRALAKWREALTVFERLGGPGPVAEVRQRIARLEAPRE